MSPNTPRAFADLLFTAMLEVYLPFSFDCQCGVLSHVNKAQCGKSLQIFVITPPRTAPYSVHNFLSFLIFKEHIALAG